MYRQNIFRSSARFAAILCIVATSASAQLLSYSFTGGTTAPSTTLLGLSASSFTGATGSPTTGTSSPVYSAGSGGGYFTASNWTGSAPGNNYFEFTVTPAAGYEISLSVVSFGYRATSTGPSAVSFRSSSDSYGSSLTDLALNRDGSWHNTGTMTLASGVFNTATTFRIYGSGASSVAGTFRIDDMTLHGTASAIPEPSTYAAIAGAVSLVGAMMRRRSRQRLMSTPSTVT